MESPSGKERPVRVAHVITRMILGGAQQNTLDTVLGILASDGITAHLVTGPSLGSEGSLLEAARDSGVPVTVVPNLVREPDLRRDPDAFLQLRYCLRRLQPHIVHTHSSKAGILGRFAAWSLGVPGIVHTIHGLPFHRYQSKALNVTYVALERAAARITDKIICVADAMTSQSLSQGVGRMGQFVTVRSGMDVDAFIQAAERRRARRKELGFSIKDLVVGSAARLSPLKGNEDFVEAAVGISRKVPRARFLLCGDGPLRGRLESAVRRAGIADRTVFAGFVPPERMPETFAAMDVLVHASMREGLARVLPQAMFAGTPVIAYDVDGTREVVVHNETGFLLLPGDVGGIVNAVTKLAGNRALGKKMAKRGRGLFAEEFRTEAMVEGVLAVYDNLLAAKAI